MNQKQTSSFAVQNDFNNTPKPVRSWNKIQGGGKLLRKTILCQLANFGEIIQPLRVRKYVWQE